MSPFFLPHLNPCGSKDCKKNNRKNVPLVKSRENPCGSRREVACDWGSTTTPPMVFCGHKWLDLAPNGGLKPTARKA